MTLHDAKNPERYGLPANPGNSAELYVWKWLAKPTGLVMTMLGLGAVFLHGIDP